MAYRPKGFGLTAELARKKSAKFDADLASDCFQWMQIILAEEDMDEANTINVNIETEKDVVTQLRDGILLCKIANIIKPNSIKRVNQSKSAFKMMENINNFLNVCQEIGVKKFDMFQSVDLYEAQNVPQVINGIVALGRKIQVLGYDAGVCLGPLESTVNKRNFSDKQLRASEGIIGLQAGSNRGASQTGISFGKTRAIID